MRISQVFLINYSKLLSSQEVTDISRLIELQVYREFGEAWGFSKGRDGYSGPRFAITGHIDSVRNYATELQPGKRSLVLVFMDEETDTPEKLGWTDEPSDLFIVAMVNVGQIVKEGGAILRLKSDPSHTPVSNESVEPGNVPGLIEVLTVEPILEPPFTVSSIASGEVLSALIDESCSQWVDGIKDNETVCKDVVMPVEADSYLLTTNDYSGRVSNFLLPSWFELDTKVQTDYLGTTPGPLQIAPGGCVIVRATGRKGSEALLSNESSPGLPWRKDGTGDMRSIRRMNAILSSDPGMPHPSHSEEIIPRNNPDDLKTFDPLIDNEDDDVQAGSQGMTAEEAQKTYEPRHTPVPPTKDGTGKKKAGKKNS